VPDNSPAMLAGNNTSRPPQGVTTILPVIIG